MLRSAILAGNARLDSAASGPPSIKKAPPADDSDAVTRIQKALAALGFSLPLSFPSGPVGEPDGKYGDETYRAVVAFQKRQFPDDPGQWDGRCGRNTLGRMDELLASDSPDSAGVVLPISQLATSRCSRA
jgi:peptidoglycan hydrolase-like protein with peptidoglycan-binding domain